MSVRILHGDCRTVLPTLADASVQCCVTSPPYYGLRDYGITGQMGLEASPAEYLAAMVAVFREVRRVLRDDGTLWLNIGDSYAGSWGAQGQRETASDDPSWHASQIRNHPKRAKSTGSTAGTGFKPKDLMMIPARLAIALQEDGWYLRSDIIWHKPNPMPESCRDRPTSAHEHVFLLSKRSMYFYDANAIREGALDRSSGNAKRIPRSERGGNPQHAGGQCGHVPYASNGTRNIRNVWTIATTAFSEAHFATFPPALAERCILAGTRPGDTVFDPFGGAGTTGMVADRLGREAVLIEINPDYGAMSARRITSDAPLLSQVTA